MLRHFFYILWGWISLSFLLCSQSYAVHPVVTKQSVELAKQDSYGFPLPKGAVARLGGMQWRFFGDIDNMFFSPDGKYILVKHTILGLILCEYPSGKWLATLNGNEGVLSGKDAVFFTPDSRYVLFISQDNQSIKQYDVTKKTIQTILTCNPEDGAFVKLTRDARFVLMDRRTRRGGNNRHELTLREIKFPDKLISLGIFLHSDPVEELLTDFTPDLRWFVTWEENRNGPNRLFLSNLQTGQIIRYSFTKNTQPNILRFVDSRRLVFVKDSNNLSVLDLIKDGTDWELRTLPSINLKADILGLTLSPDQEKLILSLNGGKVVLLDRQTFQMIYSFPIRSADSYQYLSVSPDGKTLAGADYSEQVIRFWDLTTGIELYREQGHRCPIQKLTFDRTGKYLASSCGDSTTRIWNLQTRMVASPFHPQKRELRISSQEQQILLYKTVSWSTFLRFSADSSQLFDIHEDGSLWKWQSGPSPKLEELLECGSEIQNPTISPDGKYLAASNGETGMIVTPTTEFKVIPGDWQTGLQVRGLLFSEDSKRLYTATKEGKLKIWTIPSGEQIPAWRQNRIKAGQRRFWCSSVEIDQDRNQIAIWDLHTAKWILTCPVETQTYALSANGRYLAIENNSQIQLMELATQKPLRRIWRIPYQTSFALEFSPDGNLLATGYYDGTILLWDMRPPKPKSLLATTEKEVAEKYAQFLQEDPDMAFEASGFLIYHAEETLRYLDQTLQLPKAPDMREVDRAIQNLDHARFAIRERATNQLQAQAYQTEVYLRTKLQKATSPEVIWRLEQILNSAPIFPLKKDRLQLLRLIDVLEQIGNDKAMSLLQKIADGSDIFLSECASFALSRHKLSRP